jgi:acetolactate synthase-1/2/3 large subunit
LKNPSFAQLAQAYGYAGVRITRTDEFESAFQAAIERKEGTLIEIMIDEDVITTRASLTTIREAAIARLAKSK